MQQLQQNKEQLDQIWKKAIKQQNLPVDVDDFLELASKHPEFLVDKSTFIKYTIEIHAIGMKMLMITRPMGWGKSINLSMLRYFLSKEFDSNGIGLSPQPYKNLFAGGLFTIREGRNLREIILKPLNVVDTKSFTNRCNLSIYQCIYPVIFLKFKNVIGNNYIEIKRSLVQLLNELYQTNRYLQKKQKLYQLYRLKKNQLQRMEKLQDEKLYYQSIDPYLRNLQMMIEDFHVENNECYILIDDCDSPVHSVFRNGGDLQQAKKVAQMISGILMPVIRSANTLKIIATAKINIFQNYMTNYKQFGIFQDRYYEDFGFSTSEISQNILNSLFPSKFPDKEKVQKILLERINRFYGGYRCGVYTTCKIEPGSTIKYLYKCIINNQIAQCEYFWKLKTQFWYFQQFFRKTGLNKVFSYFQTQLYQRQQKQGQKQPNFQLQMLLQLKKQQIGMNSINYAAYCLGFVTGVYNFMGKWMIKNVHLPNYAMQTLVDQFIINQLQNVYGFCDQSAFELQDASQCIEKFSFMLNRLRNRVTFFNNSLISGLFYYRYRYSYNRKYNPLIEIVDNMQIFMIDNVYIPQNFKINDQILMFQFYYQNQQYLSVSQIIQQKIFNIIQSKKLQKILNQLQNLDAETYEIVIRVFMVHISGQNQQFEVHQLIEDLVLQKKQISNIVKSMQNGHIRGEWLKAKRKGKLTKNKNCIQVLKCLSTKILDSKQELLQVLELNLNKNESRLYEHQQRMGIKRVKTNQDK